MDLIFHMSGPWTPYWFCQSPRDTNVSTLCWIDLCQTRLFNVKALRNLYYM